MTLNKIMLTCLCLISTSFASTNNCFLDQTMLQINNNTNSYSIMRNKQQMTPNNNPQYYRRMFPINITMPKLNMQFLIHTNYMWPNIKKIKENSTSHTLTNNNISLSSQEIANKIIQNINNDNKLIIQSKELNEQVNKLSSKCNIIKQLNNDNNYTFLFQQHNKVYYNDTVLTANNNTPLLKEYYNQQLNILLNQFLKISSADTYTMIEILNETILTAKKVYRNISSQIDPTLNTYEKEIRESCKLGYIGDIIMEEKRLNINSITNKNDLNNIDILKVISIFSVFIINWCKQLIEIFKEVEISNESVAYFIMINKHLKTLLDKFGFN